MTRLTLSNRFNRRTVLKGAGIAAEVSIAVNQIKRDTEARVRGKKKNGISTSGDGKLVVKAEDHAGITSLSPTSKTRSQVLAACGARPIRSSSGPRSYSLAVTP